MSSQSGTASRGSLTHASTVAAMSSSVEEVLAKQRKALVDTIKEARNAEEKRASRLERAKEAERKRLESRFELEREQDQQRISRLASDFDVLKQATSRGEFNESVLSSRHAQIKENLRKAGGGKAHEHYNRFVGLETPEDIIVHRKVCAMFDKHANDAARRRAPAFNAYEHQKKLVLLHQKRDILKQLVTVQQRELQARVFGGSDGGFGGGGGGVGGGARAFSARGGSSEVSSGESWATFASSRGSNNNQQRQVSRKPSIVPPLRLASR